MCQLTQAHTPLQNKVVIECKNRSFFEKACSLMLEANVSKFLWTRSISTIEHISNILLTWSDPCITHKEVFFGIKPNLSHL